jgi:hypothetical protein
VKSAETSRAGKTKTNAGFAEQKMFLIMGESIPQGVGMVNRIIALGRQKTEG